jgi:hypothetical protein
MLHILLSATLCRVLDSLVARYLKERDHVNAYVVQFATDTHTHQHQPSVDEQTATTKSVTDSAIRRLHHPHDFGPHVAALEHFLSAEQAHPPSVSQRAIFFRGLSRIRHRLLQIFGDRTDPPHQMRDDGWVLHRVAHTALQRGQVRLVA